MDLAFAKAQLAELSAQVQNGKDISLIMVAYHTGSILFEAINRVLMEGQVKELIIIDNGSTEKSAQRLRDLKEAEPRIKLVQGHGNIGFGRAANLGALLARQPWLVFLNPDAILNENCLSNLIDSLGEQPSPAIVGARLLNPDGSEQRGARRGEVTPMTTLISLTQMWRIFPALKKFEIHREHEPLPKTPMAVPTISGACFAVSRTDFNRLRGFDTNFFLHVEDVDLCWRAREMGGEVLFHPTASVVHEGHTSRVEPIFVEWNKGKGLTYFFRKRANRPWRKFYTALLAPVIISVSVLRAMMRPRMRNED
jgi:hypothetical protein